RQQLQNRGHQFRTHSDTEVIAHLYEEYGEQMFGQLKGMFAICLYDIKKKVVLLARDRFGEKPLYYQWQNQVLHFSSEVKSLLAAPQVDRRLNETALFYYFRTSLVPEPMTLLAGVHCLLPGHFLKLSASGLEEKKYFHLTYQVDENIQSDEEAIALIAPILDRAVERQMVSDVPIGAFLSGGIDSSTMVALLQKKSSRPIQTFNVRFEDGAYDESPIARKVAEFCGTDHHEITIPNYDFEADIFWTIIDHVGLPFRDSSAIPSYFVTKAIGQNVKVALSGDGGDELFGGYSLFQWYQKIKASQKLARPIRALSHRGLTWAQHLPGIKQSSNLRKIHRALGTSLEDDGEIPISLNAFFTPSEITALFHPRQILKAKSSQFEYAELKQYPREAQDWSALRRIMYYRSRHTLPANMLVKVDRMSMANSLEVRAPFLDPDLFAAAAQLPDRFLIRNGKGKWLIRKIMEKQLPSEVFNHPKMGFSIPLYKYQNKAFRDLAQDLLFENNPLPQLWSSPFLKTLFDEGLNTQQNSAQRSVFQSAHRLWMMMQLLGWARRFGVEWTN
ncbi:MAG: asparagine synthase (glutamine-hydrolyzing), partial [Bacteroidota bacterium]